MVPEPWGLMAGMQGSPGVFCCQPNDQVHAVVLRAHRPVTVPFAAAVCSRPWDA